MGKIVGDFTGGASSVISYSINGVLQPTYGSTHFQLSDEEFLDFVGVNYDEGIFTQQLNSGGDRSFTFTAPIITVSTIYNSTRIIFNGNTTITGINIDSIQNKLNNAGITCNGNLIIQTDIQNGSEINVNDGFANFDSATWSVYTGNVNFGSNSGLKITSASNGKTLIKAATITGTITLDVQSGVEEGDTFSIEATDNQLVINDGEWSATPVTVGNITTYTLAKAGPSKKQRLLYTVNNGIKKIRFLTDSNGKQRLLGGM